MEPQQPPSPRPVLLSWQDVRTAYVRTSYDINMGWPLKERQALEILLLGAETLVLDRDVQGQVNGVGVTMENIRGPGLKHGELARMIEVLVG